MSKLDEPNDTPGNGEQDGVTDSTGRDSLEKRMRELERENATLRGELDTLRTRYQKDRDLLDALLLSGLPADEREMQEMLANSTSLSDLLREFEAQLPGTSQ